MNITPCKILVVDDDRPLVQLTTFILEESGYQVRGAIGGREALRKVSEDLPDLILLDVMMPGLNGIEVCRKIREAYIERPVIIMYTADDRDVTRQASIAAGANELITKDTPIDQLATRLASFLTPVYC